MASETTSVESPTDHREALHAFILRVTGDPAAADDLTQETLIRAERKRSSFNRDSSLRTWLFAIGFNACRDHFRRASREKDRTADFDPAERLPADV
ncbi:MAG: RNA polymerase sigma factor, partial [Pseudomonadales bacterium]|nr:RNA polymerase sigma factor [Pseudomonadales bacterium]